MPRGGWDGRPRANVGQGTWKPGFGLKVSEPTQAVAGAAGAAMSSRQDAAQINRLVPQPSRLWRAALALLALAMLASPAVAKPQGARHAPLTADLINGAQWSAAERAGREAHRKSTRPTRNEGTPDPVIVKAAVLLDRAGFSPGVIDGLQGDNFAKALRAFQDVKGLEATGKLDQATWDALTASSQEDVVRSYTIERADVEGPFVPKVPHDFLKMSKLKRLGYRSPEGLLAEKFHTTERLLRGLNTGRSLDDAGAQIVVPNVQPLEALTTRQSAGQREWRQTAGPGASDKGPRAARVEVDKRQRVIRVFDRDDRLIAFYPVSIGSDEKPAPSGTFKVTSINRNPYYRYDPKYAFKGQKAKRPVVVRPGPRNPVGLVWIALSAPSYGLHGTPWPERIGKTESHGCVRLTNWDALDLAALVRKGTPVSFID
jgi:lipoprotein-anchoring transpeptidase ErfK/SrfK